MKTKYFLLVVILGFLAGCEPSIDPITTSPGSADFTKYVSLGNSLTAGYSDGELYQSGQEVSFPNLLAQQMMTAGLEGFKQPLMTDEYGYGARLVFDASNQKPVPAGVNPSPANFEWIGDQGPFQNLGVPGIKSFYMVPGAGAYSAINPYYKRFAANPGVSTVLEEAMAQNPTFFTLWAGNNDVLYYAFNGGAADSITPVPLFAQAITGMVMGMVSKGAKGAIANIPDLTIAPYFTAIGKRLPYNGLVLDETKAAQLNGAFAQYEMVLASYGITYDYPFTFVAGPNPFLIADENLPLPVPFNVRPMTKDELFLLTLPTDQLPQGIGSVVPVNGQILPFGIPDQYILNETELTEIRTAIVSYNTIIEGLANQYNLALVDAYKIMTNIGTSGVTMNGVFFDNNFITGNLFSTDGLHLTGKGNALVANYFIKAINAKYGSTLPELNVSVYPGIYFK